MAKREVLSAELRAALKELAATKTLLVALDFDGTLAPLRDDPSLSRMLPVASEAISGLAALPETLIALISGRGLAELREVTSAPANYLLAGSHGGELYFGPAAGEVPETVLDQDILDALGTALSAAIEHTRGVRLETKPRGFAVHVRGVADESAVIALERARRAVQPFEGVTARPGRDVLEFSVTDAHKGEALQMFRASTGATAVLFAGDDVTDEDAIRVLGEGDLGIRVGGGESAAKYHLADAEQMAVLLTELLAERSSR